MIDKAELFGSCVVDFEYVLVSVKELDIMQIKQSNTLVDNILLADKKRTRKEWTDNIAELLQRIREMETEDLNEWITWFSNVIRKLNEEERSIVIEQIKKGDANSMCSSFERLLMKENAQGRKEGKSKPLEIGPRKDAEYGAWDAGIGPKCHHVYPFGWFLCF